MGAGKTPSERLAGRARLFAAAMQQRHAHGRAFPETPRVHVPIAPTAVTPPHEIEAARAKPDHSLAPHPDATFIPASEATIGSSKT